MEDSARRYFKIVIGVIGAILSGTLIVMCLKSGVTPGPGMAWWVTDSNYAAVSHPSQYWFMLFLFVVGFVGFTWLAWHAYRS